MARVAVICVLACIVAACSSSGHSASTTTSTTAAATSAATTSGGDDTDSPQAIFAHGWPPPGSGGSCDGHAPGAAHILETFCKGTAQIEFHLPTGPKLVHGGVCWINGSNLELDWGAQPAEGFTGPVPDQFTMMMPSQPGPIDGSVAMFAFGGQEYQFPLIFGEIGYELNHSLPIAPAQVDKVEGDFSGGAFASSLSFQATFNCNGTPPPFPSVAELIQRSKTAVPIPGAG